jgi:hypothetical protein
MVVDQEKYDQVAVKIHRQDFREVSQFLVLAEKIRRVTVASQI